VYPYMYYAYATVAIDLIVLISLIISIYLVVKHNNDSINSKKFFSIWLKSFKKRATKVLIVIFLTINILLLIGGVYLSAIHANVYFNEEWLYGYYYKESDLPNISNGVEGFYITVNGEYNKCIVFRNGNEIHIESTFGNYYDYKKDGYNLYLINDKLSFTIEQNGARLVDDNGNCWIRLY
nr:hypothetical protein [Clostridia bacterium]